MPEAAQCIAAARAKLSLPRQEVAPLILGKSDLLVGDGALSSSGCVGTISRESKQSSGRNPEASNSSHDRSESRSSSS